MEKSFHYFIRLNWELKFYRQTLNSLKLKGDNFMSQLRSFDRMVSDLLSGTVGVPSVSNGSSNYPPMNISAIHEVEGIGHYSIEMALAGFKRGEIDLSMDNVSQDGQTYNILTVTASKVERSEVEYVRRGIALRDVNRSIAVSSSDKVVNASYDDGILRIDVERIEERGTKQTIQIK